MLCLLSFIFITTLSNYAYAPPLPGGWIPIRRWDVEVTLRNISDGSEATSLSFDTENLPANTDDPNDGWCLAEQYLDIDITPSSAAGDPDDGCIGYPWGLRIVTDNVEDMEGTYSGEVEPYSTEANTDTDADGDAWYDDDDIYNYGGLICLRDTDEDGNADTISDDLYFRATLAWQVYREPRTVEIPNDESFDGIDGDGMFASFEDWYEDSFNKDYGDWNADWAYLGDKSDTEYIDHNSDTGGDIVWGEDMDGDGTIEGDEYIANYHLVAYGTGTGTNIATHPWDRDGDGDCDEDDIELYDVDGDGETMDLVVYIAAKFTGKAYLGTSGFTLPWGDTSTDFLLPAGEYRTTIYLELFTE